MTTKVDDKYGLLAEQFQNEQVRMLKRVLEKYGIQADAAKRICGEFTFDLAVYFDQGEIELESEIFRPGIAFTSDEEIFYVQPSDIEYHDYAFGTVEDVYQQ